MAAVFTLPQEILVKVLDHVPIKDLFSTRAVSAVFETASNPRFAKEFLSRRCHAMSSQSVSTIDEITSHSYFGPFVDTLIFNCVRTADRHSSIKNDNLVTGLPFQVDPEETIKESSAKYAKVVRVVRTVQKNHGKINVGVVFEDVRLHQSCFGLKKLLSTTGDSTAKRAVYSPAHLKNNLKALMRICKQARCPINRIELDLGSHTSACCNRAHPIFGCRTLYSDLQEIYAGSVTPSVSLEIKAGLGPFIVMSNIYDHVSRSFRKSCKWVRPDLSCRRSMDYLSVDPQWLAAIPVTGLELDNCGFESFTTFGSVYLRQWSSQLEKFTLRNLCRRGERNWSVSMTLFSTLPALKEVRFSLLTSNGRIWTEDFQYQTTVFLDVVRWQAEGPDLKEKLLDLAARLQAEETAWHSTPHGLSKYTIGLGARIVNEEKKPSNKGTSKAEKCTRQKKVITSNNKIAYNGPSYYAAGVDGAKRLHLSREQKDSKAADLARNHPPTFRVTAANSGKRGKPRKNDKVDGKSNVCYLTIKRPVTRMSSLEAALENLSLFSEKPLSEIMPSVKFQIPDHMRKDVLEILNSGKVISTAMEKEHSKKTPAGEVVPSDKIGVADQDASRQPVTPVEKALKVRRHSNLLNSVLSNLSDETTQFITNNTQRYVLEEVEDLGDTHEWAKDLCDSINKISLSEEQKKPTGMVQRGKVTFKGAVHAEMSETDDWAEEIGWDLDQVLKKHCEKA